MKHWLLLVLALILIAGCDVPEEPQGPREAHEAVQTTPPKTTPVPDTTPDVIQEEVPSTAEELGIKVQAGTLAYKSPQFTEGQWAKYRITTPATGESFERSYSIISFFHNSESCIGIERNSTKASETRTQTMWCDDAKIIFTWNAKTQKFSSQNLGEAFWGDEAVQGMETKISGLHEVSVEAGKFWTLKRESWDGVTKKTWYGSPLVPGFEAGLVKRVETSNGDTVTTELIAYG